MIFSRIHWTLARGPPLLSESIHGVVKGLEKEEFLANIGIEYNRIILNEEGKRNPA